MDKKINMRNKYIKISFILFSSIILIYITKDTNNVLCMEVEETKAALTVIQKTEVSNKIHKIQESLKNINSILDAARAKVNIIKDKF